MFQIHKETIKKYFFNIIISLFPEIVGPWEKECKLTLPLTNLHVVYHDWMLFRLCFI